MRIRTNELKINLTVIDEEITLEIIKKSALLGSARILKKGAARGQCRGEESKQIDFRGFPQATFSYPEPEKKLAVTSAIRNFNNNDNDDDNHHIIITATTIIISISIIIIIIIIINLSTTLKDFVGREKAFYSLQNGK